MTYDPKQVYSRDLFIELQKDFVEQKGTIKLGVMEGTMI